MAKYKKKRARELKQDKFRDSTLQFFDRVGDLLEGKGRTILYGLGGVVVVAIVIGFFMKWSNRHADQARQAMGRGIAIAAAPVSASPGANPNGPSFSTAQERAQRAIDEFHKVAAKYGDPYRTEARYFIATSLLVIDRPKGLSELTELSKSSNAEVAALSKFALAQAKESDAKYDEAAALYRELVAQNSAVITSETVNLRLAAVYKQQGKKKEAADLLFGIVDAARKAEAAQKAKDPEDPAPQSQAARDAAQELQKLDPDRYAQLPPEAPPAGLPF